MKTELNISDFIDSRSEFKKRFSLWEMYRAFIFIPRAMAKLIENKKTKLVDNNLLKRLQLAVTEVNGCPACSYAHTKMALRQGMSGEEISSFLSGEDHFIKPKEAKAIMFAQHFADTRGYPKTYAYKAIIDEYGKKEAQIMISAIQIMIAGNIYGIPYSAFQARLKGKPYTDSSLFFELGMLIAGLLLLPIASVHGILRFLVGLPNTILDEITTDEQDGL
jgi:AhpD family alkylhydroperoxidase